MKQVNLPNGQTTSSLGFGGTVLKGGPGRGENVLLLRHAFEAGFRHFDVAPSYGLGVAEGILADFIKDVRHEVTVTTKVGLPRPRNPGQLAALRAFVRPFLTFTPALRRHLGRSVQRMSGSATTHFDMEHVRHSVAESMRELKTDYVDVLLLHEITPSEVSDELKRYLEDAVAKGMVLNYGIGSYRREAEATVHACSDIASILQTSWAVGDTPLNLPLPAPFTITHGAIRPLPKIRTWLDEVPSRLRVLSDEIGADLADQQVLVDLMMATAIVNNKDGIVLVSSSRADRLARHANVSQNSILLGQAPQFARTLCCMMEAS